MTDYDQPEGFPGPKAPDALRTIGEVALALGIRHHVLRYWEDQFPMLQPLKRGGGRRYYRPQDVALLRTIHRLVDLEGYTLRGARLAIEGAGGKDAGGGDPPKAQAPTRTDALASPGIVSATISSETLAQLRQVRRVLSEALAAS